MVLLLLFHVNTKAKHLIEIVNRRKFSIDINIDMFIVFRNLIKRKVIFPIRFIRISYTPIRDIKFLNDSSNLVLTIANIAKRFSYELKIEHFF